MSDVSALTALLVELGFIAGLLARPLWRKRPRRKNWQRPRAHDGRFVRRDQC